VGVAVKKFWLVFREYEHFELHGFYNSLEEAKAGQEGYCDMILEVEDCLPVRVWYFDDRDGGWDGGQSMGEVGTSL